MIVLTFGVYKQDQEGDAQDVQNSQLSRALTNKLNAIYIKDRTPRQWTKKLSEPLIETSIYIFNMIKDWLFEINRKREIPHGDRST